jgi:ATP phosphoribosyltransferase regulatory subunit
MTGPAHRLVQVPRGVQCFVGDEVRRRRAIEDVATGVFQGWDYEEIIPPLFDYADVFAAPGLSAQTYSFVDRDGNVLALRPDFTSLLAKIAAGRLAHRAAPIRLFYSGEVLRYEEARAGRHDELFQMGLEHLGGERAGADAEVVAIAAECLEALGVRAGVVVLGHVGVFNALADAAGVDPVARPGLRERVDAKDASGVAAALATGAAPAPVAEALIGLASLAGGVSVLDRAAQAVRAVPAAAAAVGELRALVDTLVAAGLGDRIAVDLGEVRALDYYTGLVFRVFAPSLGFEVGSGGRYDGLLARFGRPLPAVGFMLGLDRMALLLERQGTRPAEPPAPAEAVASLSEACRRRRAGERVRLAAATTGETR